MTEKELDAFMSKVLLDAIAFDEDFLLPHLGSFSTEKLAFWIRPAPHLQQYVSVLYVEKIYSLFSFGNGYPLRHVLRTLNQEALSNSEEE